MNPLQKQFSLNFGTSKNQILINNQKNSDSYSIPVASGLVAGESLLAAFNAIACTLAGYMLVE